VYKVDPSSYQDNGNTIKSLIRTGHINHGTDNFKRSNQLRVRLRRGVGAITGDPQFSLRWRDQGGAWSNWHSRNMGRAGDPEFFVTFKRMGKYRTRQYEIQHADNSDFTLISIEEDVEDLGK
jgi:hypothetical protein